MISKATGTFSVKLELQPASPQADAAVIGRPPENVLEIL